MTAKNILMIENTYNGVGGHDTVIVNLCLELQKLGYNPILGAFNFIVDPPEQIPTVKLKKSSFMKNSIDGLNFDIIHSHEPLMNYYCLFNKIPLIYHFHGPNGSLQALNFRLSMKICKKRISKIITVSKSSMSYLKNKIENLPVEIIYNGVETNFFLPDLPKPHVKGKPQILFVGNLLESKNVITLVYSMKYILKRYPDANLQIVGDGPEYTNLETAIEENIFLIGQENREQIKFRFSSCDIFISSSVAEQHSITAFEAMSCGKPVLLSDIPPFREVISDSGTGLIFSPYDTSEIADKVEEIFENYDKFTSNTRNWAEKFSWKDSAKQVANIYETMI